MPSEKPLYSNQELREIIENSLDVLEAFEKAREDFKKFKQEFCSKKNQSIANFDDYCLILEENYEALESIKINNCRELVSFIEQKLKSQALSRKTQLKPLVSELAIKPVMANIMLEAIKNTINLLELNLEKISNASEKEENDWLVIILQKMYSMIIKTDELLSKNKDSFTILRDERIYVLKVENYKHEVVTITKKILNSKQGIQRQIIEKFSLGNREMTKIEISITTTMADGELSKKIEHGESALYFRFIELLSAYPNMLVPISNLYKTESEITFTKKKFLKNSDYKKNVKNKIKRVYSKYFSGFEWQDCLTEARFYAEKEAHRLKRTSSNIISTPYYLDAYILFNTILSKRRLTLISPFFITPKYDNGVEKKS